MLNKSIKEKIITLDDLMQYDNVDRYPSSINGCISIYNTKFYKCTFHIKQTEMIQSVDFCNCEFVDCTFEDTCLLGLGFNPLSMRRVKSHNCKVKSVEFYIAINSNRLPSPSELSYEQKLILLENLIKDVDFTGIDYTELKYPSYGYFNFKYGSSLHWIRNDYKLLYEIIHRNMITLKKPRSIPEFGESFIGYKVVQYTPEYLSYMIAKLEIPEDAERLCTYSTKCRASKVKVLDFIDINSQISNERFQELKYDLVAESPCMSNYLSSKYKIGEEVIADMFDNDDISQCSHGIHFFMTEEDAVEFYKTL